MLKNKYIVSADGEVVGGKPKPYEKPIDEAKETSSSPAANPIQRIALWLAVYGALWYVFMQLVGFNFVSTLIFATSIAASGFVITDP